MLRFCAEHGIVADVEVLPLADVNKAFERLARNDARYRFVLEVSPTAVSRSSALQRLPWAPCRR
jgi:hypothetical protein